MSFYVCGLYLNLKRSEFDTFEVWYERYNNAIISYKKTHTLFTTVTCWHQCSCRIFFIKTEMLHDYWKTGTRCCFIKEMHDFVRRERSFDFMKHMFMAIKEAIFVCGLRTSIYTRILFPRTCIKIYLNTAKAHGHCTLYTLYNWYYSVPDFL